jgi:hypothetical protein
VKCVCGHIRALHCDGACMPDGCTCSYFEDEGQAQKPTSLVGVDHYDGRYKGKYRAK